MEITTHNNNFEKDSKQNDIFRIEVGAVWGGGSSEEEI
jgi:hypothetical protein